MWFRKKGKKQTTASLMKEKLTIDANALSALCPELRLLLNAEIKAGNKISAANFANWPFKDGVIVTLERIFLIQNHATSETLQFQGWDYHGMPESYFCKEQRQAIFAEMPSSAELRAGLCRSYKVT